MVRVGDKGIKLLIIALINVFILSIGHVYNNKILILGSCLLFMGITLVSNKKFFLPIMLFFLPWSPILKLNPDTRTFFSIVVPFVFLLIILAGFKKELYKIKFIVFPLLLITFTMLAKLLNGTSIDMPYIFFIMMLFFVPVYLNKYKKSIDFETCVLYLTTGVLSSAFSATKLMNYPHMLRYIDVYEWEKIGLTRLSGFYGDANFYAANILVAIGSVLMVLYKTRNKTLLLFQIISILILLYYGMLSVSKTFILCIFCIAAFWIISIVLSKRNILYKIGMFLTILVVLGITIVSNIFTEQLDLYSLRFGMVTDTESLTTGRSEIFKMYINDLFSSISTSFLGVGLSINTLNERASHNTLIQIIYQVGIFGLILLIGWWRMIYSILSNKVRLGFFEKYYFLILIVSYFSPWLSLDMLYFSEFFYVTILAILARNYLSINPQDSDVRLNGFNRSLNNSLENEVSQLRTEK